ncbi:hypothetical protein D3C79_1019130 [compost metagenome]
MRAHRVIVGGAPDIHVAAGFGQDVVISMHPRKQGARAIRVILFKRHLTHQHMGGLQCIIGHLDRQHAIYLEPGYQLRQ